MFDTLKTKQYGEEAIQLSKKLADKAREIQTYTTLGQAYYHASGFNTSIAYNTLAIKKCNGVRNVEHLKANALCFLAAVDMKRGNEQVAVSYLKQVLSISENKSNIDLRFVLPTYYAYNFLGVIHTSNAENRSDINQNKQERKQAFQFYKRALHLCQKYPTLLLKNITIVCHNLGLSFWDIENENADSARFYFNEEIRYAALLGNPTSDLIAANYMKAEIYFKEKKYELAETTALKVEELCRTQKEIDFELGNYVLLGRIYSQQKNNSKAIAYFLLALKLAESAGFRHDAYSILSAIYLFYKENNDTKNALYYLEKNMILKDSLYSDTKTQTINDLSTKYETEKKEAQIKTLEREKTLKNYLIIAIFIFLIGSAVAVWNKYKSIQLEKALMKQMTILQQEQAEKLQLEMDNKQRELASATLYLEQRNGFLDTLRGQIKSGIEPKKLLTEIDRNMNLEDDWQNFKLHFEQVHHTFFEKLLKIEPNLTDLEQKQCAYLKLNLSPKQVSNLLNVTPHAVSVSRTRIKKKLNLAEDVSLNDFLAQL